MIYFFYKDNKFNSKNIIPKYVSPILYVFDIVICQTILFPVHKDIIHKINYYK